MAYERCMFQSQNMAQVFLYECNESEGNRLLSEKFWYHFLFILPDEVAFMSAVLLCV